jgi:hypothetical protein
MLEAFEFHAENTEDDAEIREWQSSRSMVERGFWAPLFRVFSTRSRV